MRCLATAVLTALALLCGSATAVADFVDTFDGSSLNPAKWDTSKAVSGERWCPATAGLHMFNPGDWVDPTLTACAGNTQSAPYGSVEVGPVGASVSPTNAPIEAVDGAVSLRGKRKPDGSVSRDEFTFPFVYSAVNPFPGGDFSLTVRLKFRPDWHGVWFSASEWDPTFEPNTAHGEKNVFTIVGGLGRTYVQLLDHDLTTPAARPNYQFDPEPFNWHTYRLERVGNEYSVYYDGDLVIGPFESTRRPTRLFMGNPVFTTWGTLWWSDLFVDSVSVTGPAAPADADSDGVADSADNCVNDANPSQADADDDDVGDACDPDRDGDGTANDDDNCADDPNAGQADADGDTIGDACDPDRDGDGDLDTVDNCDDVPNPGQEDADGDTIGDACDSDRDGDGAANTVDNCADVANPTQADADNDGIGTACEVDTDGDGVIDDDDNCLTDLNPLQEDADDDGAGDACDALPHGTPEEQLKDLIDLIDELVADGGTVGGGILAKLESALRALEAAKIAQVCNSLDSALKAIEGQRGKTLTNAEADELRLGVNRTREAVGC